MLFRSADYLSFLRVVNIPKALNAALRDPDDNAVLEAAIEGAALRLRPILMTSFAFVAGLIPLMFASGAGRIGNNTIGSAAAGGMIFGTLFGVVVIPGLYVVFASLADKRHRGRTKEESAFTETI